MARFLGDTECSVMSTSSCLDQLVARSTRLVKAFIRNCSAVGTLTRCLLVTALLRILERNSWSLRVVP